MEIRTERLILRPMRAGDEEAVYDYGGDGSIDMMFDLPFDDFEEAAEYVRRSAEEWDSDDQLAFEFVILSGNKGADPRDFSRGRSASFLSMF